MDYTVQEITKSWAQLSDFHFTSGKTTRPLKYDLNQIPCDHTVEVKNRFKGLDLLDTVLEVLWTEVCNGLQEAAIKTIPKKKKYKKSKWLSEEALHIPEERKETKAREKGKDVLN